MNPKTAAKAASLYVIPCDSSNRFHVAGGSMAHVVVRSQRNPAQLYCDCRAAARGDVVCSHQLATRWYIQRTQQAQSA